MSACDALTAAIVAAPDDDLPRLVFADYLEEQGDEAYARFVRGQVERARTPAWEPSAVRWDRGLIPEADPNLYRDRLPAVVDDWNVEWDLVTPFRRGFGSAVRVRDLYTFLDTAPRLFDAAPVCELALPTAPLDAWRRFAVQPWLPRVKAVRFAGLSTPIEPIRCLCESPLATGLEIYFDRASSPAMPELVWALANSPLRQQLQGLHFRVGYENVAELINAFSPNPWPLLKRMTFVTMGLTTDGMARLRDTGLLDNIIDLNLSNNALEGVLFDYLGASPASKIIQTLVARNQTHDYEVERPLVTAIRHFPQLRQLDLSDNSSFDRQQALSLGFAYPVLSSVIFSHSNVTNLELFELLTGPIWPNLVEIDLSQNVFDRDGIENLLKSDIPEHLTWIGLPDCQKNVDVGDALQRKFAGRITHQN